ncbi:hypothetical protein H7X65_00675 [Candidatus Parcubacteria bacterium]|nr:hypothetical protein [Candidatus Parcubacteria bacterium]
MKNTPKNQKDNNHNVALAVGITGLFASALLGAHFLFNTEKGKKSLKHLKSWSFKMKGELLEKVEKIKNIDETTYTRIVDDLAAKYQKVKGMTMEEITEITKELKSNWKKIKDEAKKTQLLSAGKSKPASKPTAKKAAPKKPLSK